MSRKYCVSRSHDALPEGRRERNPSAVRRNPSAKQGERTACFRVRVLYETYVRVCLCARAEARTRGNIVADISVRRPGARPVTARRGRGVDSESSADNFPLSDFRRATTHLQQDEAAGLDGGYLTRLLYKEQAIQ